MEVESCVMSEDFTLLYACELRAVNSIKRKIILF